MKQLKHIFERIITERNLDNTSESLNYEKLSDTENFYTLEGINKENGDEEKYLIYNCSNNDLKFNSKNYSQKISDDVSYIPIMIFKNWDDEINQFFDCRATLNAKNKMMLNHYFNNKLSLYTEMCDEIMLNIDDSANFNEYILNDYIDETPKGYIYNLSLLELKKLYNITGTELFKSNIRKGLEHDKNVNEIKKSFRNYLFTYIYKKLENIIDSEKLKSIKEEFNLNEEIIRFYSPKYFWFCHNGITIFSYDKKSIDRSGEFIKLNPKKVSVINGAQTLTNFYLELENAKKSIPEIFKAFEIDLNNFSEIDYLNEACNKTMVKTIFIQGEEEFIKPITCGLNTQVPILEEHILADSEIVYKLNLLLKKIRIEILKEGSHPIYGEGLNVLEFTKKYLIIKLQPGKSKNLRKTEIKNLLESAYDDISKNEKFYLDSFNLLVELDFWWKDTKKERDTLYKEDKQIVLNSYGKNYFGSYMIYKSEFQKDLFENIEECFDLQYRDFINEFSNSSQNLSLSDFKTDSLFNRFKVENDINQKKASNCTIKLDDLKEYLEKNIKSPYSVKNVISDYLETTGENIPYFRVITRTNEKCNEAFPFPNSCFNELFADDKPIEFDNSMFKKEIIKQFPVFIIEKDSMSDKIYQVKFIKNFSFSNYLFDAKEVFQLTTRAFEKGDPLLFPKVSSKKSFHVRPKAANADDTFEFTNGERITKRTFWANKNTVEKIINQEYYKKK